MKKYFFLFILALTIVSCKKETKQEVDVSAIPVSFKIERFDQKFYTSEPQDLPKLKAEYPFLFPEIYADTVWINKMKDPISRELFNEVQKKYVSLEKLEPQIEDLLKHVKYYFPEKKIPRVITVITEVDVDAKAIFVDDYLFISLDCYLGNEHRFYETFPEYKRIEFEESQILPDIVSSFSYGKIAPPKNRTLLSLMIYKGKELYMKDLLIPDVSDFDKIAYTEDKYRWCQENESEIWSNFIENKLLYDTNPKNEQRFMNEAPFSKFYLEIDNESPGRVGAWVGWQIVRSYAENHPDVKLQELLAMDAKKIFEESKYKPKK
ncbi:gliding motility lipoprotein GldB [Flavobacterium gelidilacus]|uniref:gliding motility lipoprotein GldB n=1 Tax=Flavobacterium gelidilacus TaxID=206041 RepID=UPI000402778E|nr:gliding motility lipoprotein GldB [Flavobacterium gelidilacus]